MYTLRDSLLPHKPAYARAAISINSLSPSSFLRPLLIPTLYTRLFPFPDKRCAYTQRRSIYSRFTAFNWPFFSPSVFIAPSLSLSLFCAVRALVNAARELLLHRAQGRQKASASARVSLSRARTPIVRCCYAGFFFSLLFGLV